MDTNTTAGSVPISNPRLGGRPPRAVCSASAPSVSSIGPRMDTAYHTGATRQRTTRPSKVRSPTRPLSWAATTTAATSGPKAPRNVAGTGSDEIRPRASSAAGTHKAQVNTKANAKYFSGKALVVRDGAAVVVVISVSPLCLLSRSVVSGRHACARARRPGEVGYCTRGWTATPTDRAACPRRTLYAIHAPLIVTSTAPAGTVGGVACAPIVIAYTRPKTYINTGAATQRAPAHLGRIPERQTATPSSTLPTNPSKMETPVVAICRVFAKMVGSASNSSMPARTACPSSGTAKVE